MRLKTGEHLTYCTNVHPGETWAEVRTILEGAVPGVKALVSPEEPFGVGLRLSQEAARELASPEELAATSRGLESNGLYVFTLNGFPFGEFHGSPVKEAVYAPDWAHPARLAYTNQLANILAGLLPADVASGTISTVPVGFRRLDDVEGAVGNLIAHVAHLVALKQKTGKTLLLCLEPEPMCLLETTLEAVEFIVTRLRSPEALGRLAAVSALDRESAEQALKDHVGVCLDTCHAAVEFESAEACVAALQQAQIKIGKIQLSSGLRLKQLSSEALSALVAFDESTYLHQVVEREGDSLKRFLDLPDAFCSVRGLTPSALSLKEWRVHFHVPVFLSSLGLFESTQDFLLEVLALHQQSALTAHLEVETYTWDVLPAALRKMPLKEAIARELSYCLEFLERPAAGPR